MSASTPAPRRSAFAAVVGWFDAWSAPAAVRRDDAERVDWLRIVPFLLLHVGALGVLFTGASALAVGVAAALYVVRMFAITGFYHRYFSHRAFRANRFWQFVFAALGNSAAQKGPLWWAAHHRRHHRHADSAADLHSPRLRGFWWSHVGWFASRAGGRTDVALVRDLAKFPELVFLDRFAGLVPLAMFAALYAGGAWAQAARPAWGATGPQLLAWSVLSTVVLYHATYTINSLAHVFGRRRYRTADDSRNNFWLALLTFGEGWHNNHHRYQAAARNGFFPGEIDLTYLGLKCLEKLGIVRDLVPVPAAVLEEGAAADAAAVQRDAGARSTPSSATPA
jgi:stearoyl-CoA desaturase (delta-9 desaturase)